MAIGSGEAADRAVDDGAGRERCRSGSGLRLEREPGLKWRRALERGELIASGSTALLPVTVSAASESATQQVTLRGETPSGSIHIELPGGRLISVERGADPALLRLVLECLHR